MTEKSQKKGVQDAIEYYDAFVRYSLVSSDLKQSAPDLPTLSFLVKHGNISSKELLEIRDGAQIDVIVDTTAASEPSIDFGVSEPAIDFGAEPTIDFGAEPTIDFGGDEPMIDFGGDEPTIDFSYDTAAIDFGGCDDFVIECEASGTENVKMSEKEANTKVLEASEYRGEICNELMELAAFLEQRYIDLDKKSSAQTFVIDAPTIVQQTGCQQLKAWNQELGAILGVLNSSKTRQLIQINASIGHVDRLADALVMKRNHVDRFKSQAKNLESKEEMLQEAVTEQNHALKQLVTKVREVKVFVETTLGDQKGYDDCVFQLVGAINSVK